MVKLSLCMIVRDEEKDLENCLKAVKDHVDEIVIVDTGSKDKTVEIAKKFTSKVHHFEWCDDFSAARNESLKHATGDWILVLDADEKITAKDLKEIKTLIQNKDVDGYLIQQRNYIDQKGMGWIPVSDYMEESQGHSGYFISPLCRLFKNKSEYKFRNILHELVEESIEEHGGNLQPIPLPIHHYGQTKDNYEKKQKKYLDLGLVSIKKNPKDPKPHYEVALIYLSQLKFDDALKQLEEVEKLKPGFERIYVNLGNLHNFKNEPDKAKAYYEKAIKSKPKDVSAYCNLALLHMKLAEKVPAEVLLKKAIDINPKQLRVYQLLTSLYAFLRRHDEALKYQKMAVEKNPTNPEAWNNLGFIHYQLGEHNEAVLAFDKGLSLAKGNDLEAIRIYNNLAATYLKKGDQEKAEEILNKALKLNPKIPHSYQNLCHLYYQQGNVAKVIQTLEHAIQNQAGQLLGEQLDFHLNLSNMYGKQNQHDKALAVLEKAKTLFTQKEEKERIQQKIEHIKKSQHANPKTTYAG